MKFKLNNDFGVDRKDPKSKDFPSDQTITANYLRYGVKLAFEKTGLGSDKRRIYMKVDEKLQNAVKDNATEVEFNAVETLFLKQAFTIAVFPMGEQNALNELKYFQIVEKLLVESEESSDEPEAENEKQ